MAAKFSVFVVKWGPFLWPLHSNFAPHPQSAYTQSYAPPLDSITPLVHINNDCSLIRLAGQIVSQLNVTLRK